jgi:hypothetical protein
MSGSPKYSRAELQRQEQERLEQERLAKIEAERLEQIRLAKLAEEARLEKRKFIDEYKGVFKIAHDNTAPSSTLQERHAQFHKNNRDLEKQKGIPYATQICSQGMEEIRLEQSIYAWKYWKKDPATIKKYEDELEKLKSQ